MLTLDSGILPERHSLIAEGRFGIEKTIGEERTWLSSGCEAWAFKLIYIEYNDGYPNLSLKVTYLRMF